MPGLTSGQETIVIGLLLGLVTLLFKKWITEVKISLGEKIDSQLQVVTRQETRLDRSDKLLSDIAQARADCQKELPVRFANRENTREDIGKIFARVESVERKTEVHGTNLQAMRHDMKVYHADIKEIKECLHELKETG